MIPDSLFFLLKVPFSSFSEFLFCPVPSPCFVLSESSSFISKSSPLLLRVPSPSPIPVPVLLSILFRPLSSSPILLAAKKTAERHEAVPPFAWWLVPKWNISG